MEYEIVVICTQAYRVFVEADDDEAAQRLAIQAVYSDEAELLRDTVETTIEGAYD